MINGDDYLNQLLEIVEKKRELSIKEYARTDIYSEDDINQVNMWYARLKFLIQQKPPKEIVRSIDIYERDNQVVEIRYNNTISEFASEELTFRVWIVQDDG